MSDNKAWMKALAFAGYAAKTVVYIMLGVFVVSAAFSAFRSETPSQQQVFHTLLEQPFGRYLLLAVIVGLVCYSVFRWVQAFLNTEDLDMSKAKDVIHRFFLFVSGIMYAIGAYGAYKVYSGIDSSDGSNDKGKQISAQLMENEWGVWLVGAIGILIISFAFIQFKHAFKADFMDKFEIHKLSEKERDVAHISGRLGFGARGVVYILIGSFFALSAWHHDPDKAGGLQKAFHTLMEQSYGQYLLAAVGVGLITFGIFCAVEARYRRT